MSGQLESRGGALNQDVLMNDIGGESVETFKVLKTKCTVIGEEMIGKKVKPGGNAGRIYLPPDWVGKLVKIIRID